MSNEKKPAASTLDRKVYWQTRDGLERRIAELEAEAARTAPSSSGGQLAPGMKRDIATLRERLTALGEPPGPRVREDEERERSERRDRFVAAAITGLLANPELTSAPAFARWAATIADELMEWLDAADAADSDPPRIHAADSEKP